MDADARVLIAGATGVFGRLLAFELAETTRARLVVTSRDAGKAAGLARLFGDRAEPVALDLMEPGALARAARGCDVVVCTAGPFRDLPRALPLEAVEAGAHWFDLSDVPEWVLGILDDRRLAEAARGRQRAIAPGLSSSPAISGALTRWCRARSPDAVRARATLFVGNRNEKGAASIASALAGRFRDPVPVELPWGSRLAYRFDSADEDLLRRVGIEAEFRVVLELGPAGWLVSKLGRRARAGRLAPVLERASAPAGRFGSRSGLVQVEVWGEEGRSFTAALSGSQRLAVWPCALAVRAVLEGRPPPAGVVEPAEWLSAEPWLRQFGARGARLFVHRQRV